MQLDSVLGFAVATIVSLLVISLVATASAIAGHIRRVQDKHARGVYEDEDGKATPESYAVFSTVWQKVTVVAWATIGLGCYAIYSVISQNEQSPPVWNWLITASWVRIYATFSAELFPAVILMAHPGLSYDTSNRNGSDPRPGLCFSTRRISGGL